MKIAVDSYLNVFMDVYMYNSTVVRNGSAENIVMKIIREEEVQREGREKKAANGRRLCSFFRENRWQWNWVR